MTVVKINAITVPADSGDELARRFAARAGAVDNQDGFEGFEAALAGRRAHHLARGDALAGRGLVCGVAARPRIRPRAPQRGAAQWRRGACACRGEQRAVVLRDRWRLGQADGHSGVACVSFRPQAMTKVHHPVLDVGPGLAPLHERLEDPLKHHELLIERRKLRL